MVYPTGHTKNLRNAKISNLSNEILQKESSEGIQGNTVGRVPYGACLTACVAGTTQPLTLQTGCEASQGKPAKTAMHGFVRRVCKAQPRGLCTICFSLSLLQGGATDPKAAIEAAWQRFKAGNVCFPAEDCLRYKAVGVDKLPVIWKLS